MDDPTRQKLAELLAAAEALLASMTTSSTGIEGNAWKYGSFHSYARKYNQLVTTVAELMPVGPLVDLYDMEKLPNAYDTIAIQQQELFAEIHANLSILRALIETKLGVRADKIRSLIDFLQSNLRKAIFSEPEKELEIQNAVEQLLIGRGFSKGSDYDRETGRVKISIKEVIPDFVFQKLGVALEIKLSKTKEKSRQIVDEINADIQAYAKNYASLLFVVYDIGTIRDDVEFKHGLESKDNVSVIIVKH